MKRIVIIMTNAPISRMAAAIVRDRLQSNYELSFVNHDMYTITGAIKFIINRYKKCGFLSAANEVFLRLYKVLFCNDHKFKLKGNFSFDAFFKNINCADSINFISKKNPVYILSIAPGIFSEEFIKSMPCPIINIHNGITPRYRGIGNFWAIYEGNMRETGVTVHEIDPGIDTGRVLIQEKIDFLRSGNHLEEIDYIAFKRGAELVCEYVEGLKSSFEYVSGKSLSRYYSFPGLTHYIRALKQMKWHRDGLNSADELWQMSFRNRAVNYKMGELESMYWTDTEATLKREQSIKMLCLREFQNSCCVADLGCGTGRYSNWLAEGGYKVTAIDYVKEFIINNMHTDNLRYCCGDVNDLPYNEGAYDAAILIGILQHQSNPQRTIDELARVLRSGGVAILNTLVQPSGLVLIAASIIYGFKDRNKSKIAWAMIWKRYMKGVFEVGGCYLARRYKIRHLREMIEPYFTISEIYCDNKKYRIRLFAREVTLVIKRK